VPAVAFALLAAALAALYRCARRIRASLDTRGGEGAGTAGGWLRGAAWWLGDARWSRVAAADDAADEHGLCCVAATPSLSRLEEDEMGAGPVDEDGVEVL